MKIADLVKTNKGILSDRGLFLSPRFLSFLSKIVMFITGRYKRRVKIIIIDDVENKKAASTNNEKIIINYANPIVSSRQTREEKYWIIKGLLAHEIGHVLYSDFVLLKFALERMQNGVFHPVPDFENVLEIQEEIKQSGKSYLVIQIWKNIYNILEDAYVEDRMCNEHANISPELNYLRDIDIKKIKFLNEYVEIYEKRDKNHKLLTIMALLLDYSVYGVIKFKPSQIRNQRIETMAELIPFIDAARKTVDSLERLKIVNLIFCKLWSRIREYLDSFPEMSEPPNLEAFQHSQEPKGNTEPVFLSAPVKQSDNITSTEPSSKAAIKQKLLDTLKAVDESNIKEPAGSGLEAVETEVATDMAKETLEKERANKLYKFNSKIEYGEVHEGVECLINRDTTFSPVIIDAYNQKAEKIKRVSKNLSSLVLKYLKQKRNLCRQKGLYFGSKLETAYLYRNDFRFYSKVKIRSNIPDIVIGILCDESGSTEGERINHEREAALILHDFCRDNKIPIGIYGHTADIIANDGIYYDVMINVYADFDKIDDNDQYRIMTMSHHKPGNRDGYVLRFACERLLSYPAKVRLLINMSDGVPRAKKGAYKSDIGISDIKKVVGLYRSRGVHIITASIGDDKEIIKGIYGGGFLDITELDRMPMKLARIIEHHIR